MNQHREMQLWVESDNPDYQKAVEERLAELRERARGERQAKKRENAEAFAARLAVREDREQFIRDLFDGLLSAIPREKSGVVLCAEPPKETGHLSDSQFWNGYEWERD